MSSRRAFITLLGGTMAAWPLAAHAQQPAKVPTIGFFSAGSAAALEHWFAAFAQRLRGLGWSEGSTVAIEYLWAEGRNSGCTRLRLSLCDAGSTSSLRIRPLQSRRRSRCRRSSTSAIVRDGYGPSIGTWRGRPWV